MKTFSGPARFTWHQSTHQKAVCLVLVLGAAMFAADCGKKSEKPSSSATPPLQTTQDTSQPTAPSSDVNSQPVPAAPATNVAAAPNAGPDLGALNHALRQWLARNHRVPASFEDFSATAGVAIPPPPAGKKYVITKRMEILLVDR
jgi:hypothetical protein